MQAPELFDSATYHRLAGATRNLAAQLREGLPLDWSVVADIIALEDEIPFVGTIAPHVTQNARDGMMLILELRLHKSDKWISREGPEATLDRIASSLDKIAQSMDASGESSLVTLADIAHLTSRSRQFLVRLKGFPEPRVKRKGNQPHLYFWPEVRYWYWKTFGKTPPAAPAKR